MNERLRVIDAEPLGEDILETLEDVRERAEQGLLSSIAIAVVYRDGTTSRAWSTTPTISALIGAVSRLQAALIRKADDE